MDRIVSYNDASDIEPDGVAQIERFLFSGAVVDIAGMGIQGIGEMVLTLILEIIRVGGGLQMSHRHSRWLCFFWPICRKVSQIVLQLLSGYVDNYNGYSIAMLIDTASNALHISRP